MARRSGVLVSITLNPKDVAKLRRLAEAIQDSGNKELRRELEKGLRRAVRPMQREFKRGAAAILPRRGGLAEQVAADTRYRSKVSVGRKPSVRITATLPGHDLDAMERGRLRHPVYGHDRWVSQRIRPRWFSDSGVLAAQDARDELVKAVDAVADKLKRSG